MSALITPTSNDLDRLQEFTASARASINRLRAKAVVALEELGDREGSAEASKLAKLASNQLGLIDEFIESWQMVAAACERRSEWRLSVPALEERIQALQTLRLKRLELEEGQLNKCS